MAEPVGFAALKEASIPGFEHLAPWAAAGVVVPARRGQGIGLLVLQGLVAHAVTLPFETVRCRTSTAITLLQRAGWHELATTTRRGSAWSCSAAVRDRA